MRWPTVYTQLYDIIYVYMISSTLLCCALTRDVQPQTEKYLPHYSVYHNLSSINFHIMNLINTNPQYLRRIPHYTSESNHSQLVIHMTDHSHRTRKNNQPKIPVLFSFGEHAREFLPIESLFDLLHNITLGMHTPHETIAYQFSQTILRNFDVYIIAMANPDGRLYVERTRNYCWRGNSRGVDLNRNFPWQFGNVGSSGDSTDEEFRGSAPLSEKETHVFVNLSSHTAFTAFISFHSGIRHIYIPYCDSESQKLRRLPENYANMVQLAHTLSTCTSQHYQYGSVTDLLKYTADGTVIDYMAGVRRVPFSLAIELWGESGKDDETCFDLFNPPSQQLKSVVVSIRPMYTTIFHYLLTWTDAQYSRMDSIRNNVVVSIRPMYTTIFHYLLSWTDAQYSQMESIRNANSRSADLHVSDLLYEPPSLTFSYVLLAIVFLLVVVVAVKHQLPCQLFAPSRRIISLRALGATFHTTSLKAT